MIKKKNINYILIPIIIIFIIWIGLEIYRDAKNEVPDIGESSQNAMKNLFIMNNVENEIEENNEVIQKEYPKEEIIEEYRGYKVSAKLVIPQINLETYILEEYTEDSLNKSVAKFWGADPNKIGNLCVAGHNAPRNKNMFYNLKQLNVGDKLTISDRNIGKVEYEIYNIYVVPPENIDCLSQATEGRRETTLITCTNDSSKRTIVKAREVI